ncbi:hypothetical protein HHL14_32375 [Paraburkholderia sp. G-4-1-8]|uniref:Uncharacterized protein n=1 Tax=Paraburkholderia antibiotica TaxID=2728839 RepID=A0A7Y0A2X9_9BURK|nr:hypothetical protein [Paraburkholderia antibiotica]
MSAFAAVLSHRFLHEHVEFCTMLVDRSPQQIRLAVQPHEHLVQMPCAAWFAPRSSGALGESSAKFVALATDRFVRDHDTALKQQLPRRPTGSD